MLLLLLHHDWSAANEDQYVRLIIKSTMCPNTRQVQQYIHILCGSISWQRDDDPCRLLQPSSRSIAPSLSHVADCLLITCISQFNLCCWLVHYGMRIMVVGWLVPALVLVGNKGIINGFLPCHNTIYWPRHFAELWHKNVRLFNESIRMWQQSSVICSGTVSSG